MAKSRLLTIHHALEPTEEASTLDMGGLAQSGEEAVEKAITML